MIGALVVAALALVALAYVLGPLRGRRTSAAIDGIDLREARSRKRAALDALLDLEEERAIGKLSQSDFEILRSEYEVEAIKALRDLDLITVAESADDPLETKIAALRAQRSCPECGAPRDPGQRCPRCGA